MANTPIVVDFKEIQFCNKNLGIGNYGKVDLAKWRNREIAVKQCFPKASYSCQSDKSGQIEEGEVSQLSRVRHKNIVELYAVSKHNDMTYLLMEYMEGGSLDKFLYGPRRSEHEYYYALNWAHQVAQGLAYMHGQYEKPIIHRDIKPDNILLSRQYLTIKIGDFGNATCHRLNMTCENGTPIYMAPEVLQSTKYTEKCDVYSYGITLWEMLAMQRPLAHFTDKWELYCEVRKGDRPSFGGLMKNCPQTIKELIISCWANQPKDRPSMESVAKDLKDTLSKAGL